MVCEFNLEFLRCKVKHLAQQATIEVFVRKDALMQECGR